MDLVQNRLSCWTNRIQWWHNHKTITFNFIFLKCCTQHPYNLATQINVYQQMLSTKIKTLKSWATVTQNSTGMFSNHMNADNDHILIQSFLQRKRSASLVALHPFFFRIDKPLSMKPANYQECLKQQKQLLQIQPTGCFTYIWLDDLTLHQNDDIVFSVCVFLASWNFETPKSF